MGTVSKRSFLVFLFCAFYLILSAQGYESMKKTNLKKHNKTLERLVQANDVEGLRKLLKSKPEMANEGSSIVVLPAGSKVVKPLFYEVVERFLKGESPLEMCKVVLDANCMMNAVYDGKSPIYLLMDFLATHKKTECVNAEKLLDAFMESSTFDPNLRYRSLLPPFAYLIRKNYEFCGNRFNSEYISDHVLNTFISHGASVSTYYEDGSSLMDFAMVTDNKYLQDYFIAQGINLRHSNDEGKDAVHRAIAEGNLTILKQMIEKGNVIIDIKSLTNNPTDFKKYPDMYDFIASNCATKATDYEDITLFRSKFPDKKNLVKNKYEQLASNELNKVSNFDEVIAVQKRYPDLETVMENKKQEIYRSDCNRVMSIYNEVLSMVQNGSNRKMNLAPEVNAFISTYKDKHNYDPDNKLPLLTDLKDYFTVCDAQQVSTNHSCVHFSEYYFFGERTNLHEPIWDDNDYRRDHDLLSRALSICRNSESSDFKDFFSSKYPSLQEKYTNMESNYSSSRRFYSDEITEYKEKKKLLDRKLNDELSKIDASNIKNYVLEEDGWYRSGNWLGDLIDDVLGSEKDEEVYCTVTFKELASSGFKFHKTIYYDKGKYTVSTDLFGSASFSTYHDALCFVYLREFGRSWSKNEL